MASKTSYPWFFYFRIVRIATLVFLPLFIFTLFLFQKSYEDSRLKEVQELGQREFSRKVHALEESKIPLKDWCSQSAEGNFYILFSKTDGIICQNKPGSFDVETLAGKQTEVQELELINVLRPSEDLSFIRISSLALVKDEMSDFNRIVFFKLLPLFLAGMLIFMIMAFQITKPLGNVLHKVQKLKADLPFNTTLKHFYKKDEWALLDEALNKADKKLQDQMDQVKTENKKIGAILESIYDDIIAIDTFETVLFYNSNFERNFLKKIGEGNEIIPKVWHTFSDNEVLEAFRRVLKTGERESLKGFTFQAKEGNKEKFYDLTITSLRSAEGKIIGALGVFYDVTEFRLTEQMRVDFVANVSHEIRTPLTSIKGYTQILQTQSQHLQPELRGFLDKIISNTERMISLFNDLLNLSVIESKDQIRFEELDLTSLIESISDNIITNYSHKKVSIEHELNLPHIRGDHRLIEQVISNLIDNACKYSGDEISVKVSTFEKDKHGYIIVADKGPGISKEHLQRIFERFYRVDASREAMRGTGLGLSIVKHIIAKHGGRIWAESEEQIGSTFIVELPLK